ncbi:alpha/beta hydrolase-fold protein [Dialister sp.]|uniref:alpha/beta hydrolase-fold protein n=1 Tax=Dialister sp. TaxID=1955814 RepID=UPI003F0D4DC1
MKIKKQWIPAAGLSILLGFGGGFSSRAEGTVSSPSAGADLGADQAVTSMKALGFVDTDGSKLKAVVLSYDRDIPTASVTKDTYQVTDYGTTLTERDLTQGNSPGTITKVYVNDRPETSAKGGTASGRYVVIEVNTDYQTGRFPRSYRITMAALVKQVKPVSTGRGTIQPSVDGTKNYTPFTYVSYDPQTGKNRAPEEYNYAVDGTYTISGLSGYELHTLKKGNAFHAYHCFDEANGKYWDFDLPYAIYVPKDYHPSGKYGLVLHIHDAGSMDSDPMLTLTESQAAANYASDRFQEEAKEKGLDGVIVLCPAIAEFYPMDKAHPEYSLRMARDNWTLSCAAPAIWELMDQVTRTYSIDKDRIYGSGQSMGGMTVMAMAAQRDNYFAALLPMSCKWGNNYDKSYPFNGETCYNAPADGTIIWNRDSHGNPCDYNNWFYMISDDNILYLNTKGENVEYRILYHDLAGVDIPSEDLVLDSSTTPEKRSSTIRSLVSRKNKTGIYQAVLTGNVSHMSAWFYGHGTPACYDWLLSQTRKTEMARKKLPLNRPFVPAEEQIQNEDRLFYQDRKNPDKKIYYPTGKRDSGTGDYNSGLTALGSDSVLAPGWKSR